MTEQPGVQQPEAQHLGGQDPFNGNQDHLQQDSHIHDHSHDHEHSDGHYHDHGHSHDHGHGHSHGHGHHHLRLNFGNPSGVPRQAPEQAPDANFQAAPQPADPNFQAPELAPQAVDTGFQAPELAPQGVDTGYQADEPAQHVDPAQEAVGSDQAPTNEALNGQPLVDSVDDGLLEQVNLDYQADPFAEVAQETTEPPATTEQVVDEQVSSTTPEPPAAVDDVDLPSVATPEAVEEADPALQQLQDVVEHFEPEHHAFDPLPPVEAQPEVTENVSNVDASPSEETTTENIFIADVSPPEVTDNVSNVDVNLPDVIDNLAVVDENNNVVAGDKIGVVDETVQHYIESSKDFVSWSCFFILMPVAL